MFTPQASTTTASASRTTRNQLTAYERVLALAITVALAAVAVLALLIPTTTASTADQSDGTPTVSNGQVARGKATLPQSVPTSAVETSPVA